MTTEMQGRVVNMCRAKGFKGHGEYEEVKGFEAQHLGHTITAVFDPDPVSATGFISVFAEPQEAAEFLTYKRGARGRGSLLSKRGRLDQPCSDATWRGYPVGI